MSKDSLDFSLQIQAFADKTVSEIEDIRIAAQKAIVAGTIEKTPVDTGQARRNWQAAKNSLPSGTIKYAGNPESAGESAVSEAQAQAFGEDGTFYFVNNLKYARVLEYGEYPNPPVKGSRVKKANGKWEWVIKSDGGYSKQAPAGMARLTVQEVSDNLKAKYG